MASFGTLARATGTRFVSLAFIAVLGACGGSAAETKGPATGGGGAPEVGKAAPDLSIQTVNGKGTVSIASLSGKVAVIDFWATWCKPCKISFPKLEELGKRHQGRVEVIGVSVDDDKDGIMDFAQANGATFALGWDKGHAIATRWRVETMPTTFILDASGTVRFIHAGYHEGEGDAIDKELLSLVNESPSKAKTAVASTDAADATKPAASASATPATPDAPADDSADKPAADAATAQKPKKTTPKSSGKPPAKKAPPKKK